MTEETMLGRLFDIRTLLINVPITLIALTLHELAHGWVSGKLGDPTPKRDGRMTLNPLAHLDVLGTILMIFTGFGWAKPVMVNPMYYKDRKKGMALVGLAGPVMNMLLAFAALLLFTLVFLIPNMKIGIPDELMSTASYVTQLFVVRNLCFAVFNFIPIPPLDGSRIVTMFLPDRAYYKLMSIERYGMIIIMLLSITGVFDAVIGTGVNALYRGMVYAVSGLVGLLPL